jgi:hypothetical protein
MALAMSALQAIPVLTGTQNTGFAWTLYTGDLVSHDAENLLSRCVITIVGDQDPITKHLLTDLMCNTSR